MFRAYEWQRLVLLVLIALFVLMLVCAGAAVLLLQLVNCF